MSPTSLDPFLTPLRFNGCVAQTDYVGTSTFSPLFKVCRSAYEFMCMFVCVCVHWSQALIEQTDGMEVGGVLKS